MKKFLYILPVMALMFVANSVFAAPYTADDFVITVKTDNSGTSNDNQFTIPTTGLGYHYSVDCSYNGTDVVYDTTNHSGDYTCDYGPNSGIYTVVIHGTFPQIYFNDGGDKRKILSIEQWGTSAWRSMEGAFHGCYNLKLNAQDTPNLSLATSMYEMFHNAVNIGEGTGNWDWDTSHITNMESLFLSNSSSNFNADITSWNVSSVTNMKNIFFNTSFDRDISSWDVHMVEDLSGMFLRTPFNQNIGNWNTASATRTSWMFYHNTNFNQDISNWDVADVVDMSYMFDGATSFDQNLGSWDVSNVSNFLNIFHGITLSTDNYDALLNGWNAQTLHSFLNFDGGNSKYCAVEAHDNLISPTGHSWTITDGGQATSCYEEFLYRFWSKKNKSHFYTANEEEKNYITEHYGDVWKYEGIANDVFTTQVSNSTPVYRFWSKKNKGHFYTASEEEKNYVINHYDDYVWKYEGIAYYAYSTQQSNTKPVYRFWSKKNKHHFYTASEEEKNYVIAHYDDYIWKYEGEAWFVPSN